MKVEKEMKYEAPEVKFWKWKWKKVLKVVAWLIQGIIRVILLIK